ncbi:MAG TPA: hypothetical protein VIM02_00375 [Rhizomicrobium sp.]|jgi:hypothetical protein
MLKMASIVAVVATLVTSSAVADRKDDGRDCMEMLRNPRIPLVSCQVAWRLPDSETLALRVATDQLINGADCKVHFAARRTLIARLRSKDTMLLADPQKGSCRLQTSGGPLSLAFIVAPAIHVHDGRAIAAELRFLVLTGPPIVSPLLTKFVNSNQGVAKAIIDGVNKFVEEQTRQH